MSDKLKILPWWDPTDTPEGLEAGIQQAKELLEGSPAMPMFQKRSLLSFVFMANKLERTLPNGYEDFNTYQMLEQQLDDGFQSPSGVVQTWPAEGGGNSAQTRQQLLQFGRAVQHMCWPLRVPLTVEDICMAHKLMMSGAEEEGHLLAAGEYRETPAHSGTGYVYPEASCIKDRMKAIVGDFNVRFDSKSVPSYILAADLLYQFVTLHPFQNGNGRMCRLLAAYAAQAAGESFLLHLSNGHNKTRQHYQQVLRHADKCQGDTTRLRYLLESMHLQWQNAVAYAKNWVAHPSGSG